MEGQERWINGQSVRGHMKITNLMLQDIIILAAKTACPDDRLRFTDSNNRSFRNSSVQRGQRQGLPSGRTGTVFQHEIFAILQVATGVEITEMAARRKFASTQTTNQL